MFCLVLHVNNLITCKLGYNLFMCSISFKAKFHFVNFDSVPLMILECVGTRKPL